MSLANVTTRQEALDLLEGYAEERQRELSEFNARRPLVKSYMLETVPHDHEQPDLEQILLRAGHTLTPLDETLFKIHDGGKRKTVGLLEKLLPRYPVIYTYEETREMDPWVNNLVQSSPALDRLWLSGIAFEQLLGTVIKLCPGHRYGRLVFRHSNIFGPTDTTTLPPPEDSDDAQNDTADENDEQDLAANEERYIPERRDTRFEMIDRLNVLQQKLPQMRDLYSPLHSISQLRFPARGPGGHDFFYHGKATNRSDSFADHRQHIRFVLKMYSNATEQTETTTWQGAKSERIRTGSETHLVIGAPVLLKFSETLPLETFQKFITSTFRRKANKFRLWGNPIELEPAKVHVYGLDRHLWQPVFLEITDRHIVAIIPPGTCGNTVHRLVTNVQQFIDPGVEAWVGNQKYEDVIRASSDLGGVYEEDSQ
jgi:hypothetical protein